MRAWCPGHNETNTTVLLGIEMPVCEAAGIELIRMGVKSLIDCEYTVGELEYAVLTAVVAASIRAARTSF